MDRTKELENIENLDLIMGENMIPIKLLVLY